MKRPVEKAFASLFLIVLVLAAKTDLLAAPGEVIITHASIEYIGDPALGCPTAKLL